MKLTTFDMLRVWAALTGVVLAAIYFVAAWLDLAFTDSLAMLVFAIGGFEMMLFAQDLWLEREGQHG